MWDMRGGYLRNKCKLSGWCPLCYSGGRGRGAYRGHLGFREVRPPRLESYEMAVRRSAAASSGVPDGQACSDPSWSSRWPDLAAHLFDTKFEDGSPRATSTLMVLAELGVVKACLNDREEGRSSWVSGRTVDEVLELLDNGLRTDGLDWRARPAGRWDKKRK
jgi:hypothetical protein